MASITPPKYVKEVLFALQARGYAVHMVGGCVRDMILGVQPNDWDLCTSALPDQVMELFPGAEPTGLKHGTITVPIGSHTLEVTTFRTESGYSDHRRPDAVSFVSDLTLDLGRRDFTINAMAISADGLFSDPYDGHIDLQNKIIRTVGDPCTRFEEDALRMFRAFRFSSRLGFTIQEATLAAIREKAPLAAYLAPERIRDELEKVLLTNAPEAVFQIIDCGLLDRFLLNRPPMPDPVPQFGTLMKRAFTRWSALCIYLANVHAISSPVGFLTALHLDSRTIHGCEEALLLQQEAVPDTPAAWKQLLRRYGRESVACSAACRDLFTGSDCAKDVRAVLKSGECYSIESLAVSGADLMALGLRGRAVGEMLEFLLDYVIDYPDNNRKDLLLMLARNDE